ncbi:glycosyltransferase [Oceanobacillus longus]|uniref:Glycosyltransferase n=1 Tax=Oceanobacillus longus TaxID=930120 RepID=A0ABV8H2P3_9BACI
MSKEKVAIFTMNNSLSGAEKRFIRIASELSVVREDILLIINKELLELAINDTEISTKVKFLLNKGCLITLNKTNSNNRVKRITTNFYSLFRIIKNYNIKIIHCSLGALKYTLLKKFVDIKVIAEITSPDVAFEITQRKKYKYMVPNFDKIIAVSQGVEEKTIKSLETLGYKSLSRNVHCSSIPFFLPKVGANEFDKFEKENLIVFASRFVDRKNPVLFAQAVNKFLNENGIWKVAILGKGPLEDEVKLELKKHIASERVIVEHTKDIYGYLKRSKLFVSLIYPDNYPSQSILEAMFMKNAILATSIGNTNKLVTEKNGYLVDYDIESILKGLKDAVLDDNSLLEMGEQSLNLIKEKFSKDIYIDELQNIYESLK